MKLADVAGYAWANLLRHKLRSALTAIGVAVGVTTLTVLVSLGAGLEHMVRRELDRSDLVTRINVMPQGTKSQLFRGVKREGDPPPLTDETVAALRGLPGVQVAYPAWQTQVTGEMGPRVLPGLVVEGLPAEALGPGYQEALLAGKYWTRAEAGRVVVIPSDVVEELGLADANDAVGMHLAVSRLDTFYRYKRSEEPPPAGAPAGTPPRVRYERPEGLEVLELEVVGVYSSQAYGMSGQRLHAPQELARELVERFGFTRKAEAGHYPVVIVKATDAAAVPAVIERIEQLDLDTLSVFDYLQVARVFFVVLESLLALFGGVGLTVAFFGIANTMVMAVVERTREIGVFKALGARNRDIRRLVYVEAALIGLLGGALGLSFGAGLGGFMNALANRLLAESLHGRELTLFHVPTWLALGVLGLSTGVAVAAGVYPAIRAARLDPAESLRME